MSRKRDHSRSCAQKRAYSTFKQAEHHLNKILHKNKAHNSTSLQIYLCASCRQYHLGNRTPYCFEYGPHEL